MYKTVFLIFLYLFFFFQARSCSDGVSLSYSDNLSSSVIFICLPVCFHCLPLPHSLAVCVFVCLPFPSFHIQMMCKCEIHKYMQASVSTKFMACDSNMFYTISCLQYILVRKIIKISGDFNHVKSKPSGVT